MLRHYFVFVALIQVSLLASQKNISGTVMDSTSLKPLSSANIYIGSSKIGTITNENGKFSLFVPSNFEMESLVISYLGYKDKEIRLTEFENNSTIKLSSSAINLNEISVKAKELSADEIVRNAISSLNDNLLNQKYILKGFLRYKEKNDSEYRWLIESAINLFDSGDSNSPLKVGIEATRKSIDYRDVDSLGIYSLYYKNKTGKYIKPSKLKKKPKEELTALYKKAILWNDIENNSLDVVLKGKVNLLRNINQKNSIFGLNLFKTHKFDLDSTFYDSEKWVHKIKVSPTKNYIDLKTNHTYNDGFSPVGWLYIDEENYAIKKIDYALVATEKNQVARSKTMFNRKVVHSISMLYEEFEGKMYLKYISYKTPKIINFGMKPQNGEYNKGSVFEKNERFYFSELEVLFSELVTDRQYVDKELEENSWDSNMFRTGLNDKSFWKNYNILLESKEEQKMIQDLEKKISLKVQFEQE